MKKLNDKKAKEVYLNMSDEELSTLADLMFEGENYKELKEALKPYKLTLKQWFELID